MFLCNLLSNTLRRWTSAVDGIDGWWVYLKKQKQKKYFMVLL